MPIILKKMVMTGSDLKRADPGVDQYGRPIVSIEFTSKGADAFADVTRRNVGKPLAILLDGRIISAPNISEPILGGKAQISGSFSPTEVQDLVIKLKAGSLPVPVQIVAKEEVGPSLGMESIRKSIVAGLLGFLFIAIFMIVIYRYLGLMAVIALLFYAALNLATLNLLHVTLTLPGIAGILLGLGMAVDANVLIFERYKEELRNGNTVLSALDAGFSRAMITIVDSNVTTLLTAGTLFWFGTGTIKGFAVTLSIGIILSMITSLVLSKFLLSASLTIPRIRESRWVKI
jgi:preprotein translocase subunit SecD